MKASANVRRVERVRYELKRRDVEVRRVTPLGKNFLSITFGGDALEDFVSGSFDDHVKFMFVDGDGEPVARDYTPRHYDRDRRELTIEFARHGDGKASEWAANAVIGQRAVIGGPRGSMIIPADYDWHLLIGDETALPAIHRRLEELPATAEATVIVLGDADDRRAFESAARLNVQWVASPDALIQTLLAWQVPAGEGFAWGAGEASVMTRLREILLRDKGIPKEAMRVAAYWKRGASSFHQNLE